MHLRSEAWVFGLWLAIWVGCGRDQSGDPKTAAPGPPEAQEQVPADGRSPSVGQLGDDWESIEDAPLPPFQGPYLGKSPDEWLEQLKSPDREARLAAVRAFQWYGPDAASMAPKLLALLRELPETQCMTAAWALGGLRAGATEAIPELIQMLDDADTLPAAAAALGALGSRAEAAIPVLIAKLTESSQGMRAADSIHVALREIGPGSVPALAKALEEGPLEARRAAGLAFTSLGPIAIEAGDTLVRALDDPDVAFYAVATLADAGGPEVKGAVPALVKMLEDDAITLRMAPGSGEVKEDRVITTRNVHLQVMRALAKIGHASPELVAALGGKLDHADPNIRSAAVQALANIGPYDASSLPVLVRAYAHAVTPSAGSRARENRLRLRATIVGFGDEAVAAAEDLLGDANPATQSAAKNLLAAIKAAETTPKVVSMGAKQAAASTLPALVEAFVGEARSSSVVSMEALKHIGAPAVPHLLKYLKDEDANLRHATADLFSQMGPEAVAAAPALRDALNDSDQRVRREALSALGRIGTAAIPHLVDALQSADAGVRAEVLGSLAWKGKDVIPFAGQIAERLGDEDPTVRQKAALCLWRPFAEAPSPVGIAELKAALEDETPEVRWQAAIALAGRGQTDPRLVPLLVEALRRGGPLSDAALRVIPKMGPEAEAAVPAMLEHVKSRSGPTGRVAIRALGEMGPAAKTAEPVLIAMAQDPRFTLRAQAAYALWQIDQHPVALQALFDCLASPARFQGGRVDTTSKATAAQYLGEVGPAATRAAPQLAATLKRSQRARQGEVPTIEDQPPLAVALWKIRRSPKAIDVIVRILEMDDARLEQPGYLAGSSQRAIRAAIEALAEFGDGAPSPVPHLVDIMEGKNTALSILAAKKLWEIDQRQSALAKLIEHATRGDFESSHAFAALGEIGPAAKDAVPALLRCLQEGTHSVRGDALRALTKIDPEAAEQAQQGFLRTPP